MTEVAVSLHSPLGPSSAKRWLSCPGSVLATKDLPDTTSVYAAEGTAAHTVAEWARREFVSAVKFLDQVIEVDEYKITVDREMVEAVDFFCDYVADLEGVPLVETRVRYETWVPGGFGTLDHACLGETCHIVDFKYGKGVQVFAEHNEQMMLYALGVLAEYDWICEFKTFKLHIVQPRLDHADAWEISKEELLKWAGAVVRPGAARTKDPNAPFRAGDWCQFCKIKATCKVRANLVFETVVGDLEDLDAPVREISVLSAEEIAAALPHLGNIKRWCTDLEKHAMSEIRQGHAIGDYKIVEGRSNRAWAFPEEHVAAELEKHGIPDEVIYEPRSILSVAKIEKKLGKRKDLLDGLYKKPVGSPTLAPGSDRRQPMVIDVTTEFNDLGSDE